MAQDAEGQEPWEHLDKCLINAAKACYPTESDRVSRQNLLDRIGKAVTACSHWCLDARVIPYGSYVSGVYNAGSDMDVAIAGYVTTSFLNNRGRNQDVSSGEMIPLHELNKNSKGQVLRKLVNKLLDFQVTRRDTLQYILHARVPIVKFRDAQTGIQVDLSLGGDGQHIKAATFRLLGQVNPRFVQLYVVVKQWAKTHGINDGTIGMFNSHCLALLVIFYLQVEKQLLPPMYRLFYSAEPPESALRLLQDGDPEVAEQALHIAQSRLRGAQNEFSGKPRSSLADELLGFVQFYAHLMRRVLLESSNLRLSTWYGQLLRGASPLSDYTLAVEEPLNASDNPGRTFGKKGEFPWNLHFVLDVFERTTTALTAVKSDTASHHAGLAFLFGPTALVTRPLAGPIGKAFDAVWCEWCDQALRVEGQTEGTVMQRMIKELQAPVSQWLPDSVRDGPLEWKRHLLRRTEQQFKAVRRSSEGVAGAAAAQAAMKAVTGVDAQLSPQVQAALIKALNPAEEDARLSESKYEMHAARSVEHLAGAEAAALYAFTLSRYRIPALERKAQRKAEQKAEQRERNRPAATEGSSQPVVAYALGATVVSYSSLDAAHAVAGSALAGLGAGGSHRASSSGGGASQPIDHHRQQAHVEHRAPLSLAADEQGPRRERGARRVRSSGQGSGTGSSGGGVNSLVTHMSGLAVHVEGPVEGGGRGGGGFTGSRSRGGGGGGRPASARPALPVEL